MAVIGTGFCTEFVAGSNAWLFDRSHTRKETMPCRPAERWKQHQSWIASPINVQLYIIWY